MTSLATRTTTALRSNHDELASVVAGLSEDQLGGPSGASEWTIAQVLSHLGSGAEITLAGLGATVDGTAAPDQDFYQSVWDRWDALGVRDQADGSLAHDERLVAALEELTLDQHETVQVPVGFLPEPLSVASFAGMRLNEAVLHSWDVRVGLDQTATLSADAADVLLEQLAGGLGFLLGFAAHADAVSEPAVVTLPGTGVAVVVDGSVTVSSSHGEPTAAFHGDREAAVRLFAGRLTPAHTPSGVEVTGNLALGDLRRVFPGY